MNSLIENLNGWGETFLRFAWPMLWQSSLLIALVFALDFTFARKIRASIRYALWLMVLVKLLLPPTLALPTGAAWWLIQPKPAITAPVLPKYTISYDNPMPSTEIPTTTPAVVPETPKPRLIGAAWLLLTSATFSLALFIVLIYRWRQVAQKIRMASDAEKFSIELEKAKSLASLHSVVRLKIVEAEMSPAVCGLFRPVILLPRALAEKLSAGQLRAVLLHEIFHLRRRDVWVNCAQALLQIFYWWHPLLWVANARIRRVREEAVDDAVMLALRDEAETYAPTLLEVAKLALRRPLMTLGLVGIMESRSALRQRVERLVDFRAPRKAGLTFLSVLGIFAFSAVALPMGEAPEKSTPDAPIKVENAGAVIPPVQKNGQGLVDDTQSPKNTLYVTQRAIQENSNQPAILIQAELYRMHQTDFEKIIADPAFVGTKQDQIENFRQFKRLLKASGFDPFSRPRILTTSGKPAEFFAGEKTNSVEIDCEPVVTNGLIDLGGRITVTSSAENSAKINFLDRITLESGSGHIYSLRMGNEKGPSNLVVAVIGVQIVTNTTQFQQRLNRIVKPANTVPSPQIHIKARFIEITRDKSSAADPYEWYLRNADLNNTNLVAGSSSPGQNNNSVVKPAKATGILNDKVFLNDRIFKAVLNGLNSAKGVEDLGEPECTSVTGREVRMFVGQTLTVVTNFTFEAGISNETGSVKPQMAQIDTGVKLDVIPHLLSDGYTINLSMSPSVKEFLGYDQPPDVPNLTGTNNRVQLPVVLPKLSIRQMTADANVWDGQTVALIGMTETRTIKEKTPVLGSVPGISHFFRSEHEEESDLIVFVTANIVDPSGKRLHSDDELPFAQKGIPSQPAK